jgi:hypothetical protein
MLILQAGRRPQIDPQPRSLNATVRFYCVFSAGGSVNAI